MENQYQCNQNVWTTLFIVLLLHRVQLLSDLFDETVDICELTAEVLMWYLENTFNLEVDFLELDVSHLAHAAVLR